jgi:hypothetical protein
MAVSHGIVVCSCTVEQQRISTADPVAMLALDAPA